MKLAGEAQAEVIKVVAIGAAVLLAVWAVKKGMGAAQDAVSQTFDDALDAVIAVPGKVWSAVEPAVQAVNPVSSENLAYRGANSVVHWAFAPQYPADSFTIGGWIYDLTH